MDRRSICALFKSGRLLLSLVMVFLALGISGCGKVWVQVSQNSTKQWSLPIQLGETGANANVQAIAADANYTYVAGWTNGDLVSCNGISANCTGSSQGTTDYFVSKYAQNGTWIWTRQLGETGYNTGAKGVEVDSSGNVYVDGYTGGNLVSCNGASADCTGTAQGSEDYFISKYSSAGTWLWTKQLGETGKVTGGYAMSIDSSANVYVTGQTQGNLPSCGGVSSSCSGSSTGSYDYFVSKYTSAGTWVWTDQLGEASKTTGAYGVAVDSSSNVYVVGTTTGNMPSCGGVPGSCSGSAQGSWDYFVTKYSSSGAWDWTTQLGETGKTADAYKIATDSSGNVYVDGNTTGNLVSCNGVSASCTGSSQGTSDLFITKYSTTGAWDWTTQLGESGVSTGAADIAIDGLSNVYITGSTSGYLPSCNGVSASCTGSSQGTSDMYMSKYTTNGTWVSTDQLGETGSSTSGNRVVITAAYDVFVDGNTTGYLPSCSGLSAECTGSSQGTSDYYGLKF